MDIQTVQTILGHRSLLTTVKYTHLSTHSTDHADQLLNDLMNRFSLGWGGVK